MRCQPPCEAVNWNFPSMLISLIIFVSLLVRLWIEIYNVVLVPPHSHCQPPCEAVNWNLITVKFEQKCECQPPCEAVNWNSVELHFLTPVTSQPPCEAVNWNISVFTFFSAFCVSLLVRLWIEMRQKTRIQHQELPSASLWGCELKFGYSVLCCCDSLSASLWGCELKY